MRRHYIIDGYNAIFQLRGSPSLQKARDAFIESIIEVAEKTAQADFSIVFDAHERKSENEFEKYERLSTRSHKGPIEIIFTGTKETADSYIISHCQSIKLQEKKKKAHSSKKNIIIVTSDRHLSTEVSSIGFSSISIDDFYTQVVAKKNRAQHSTSKENPLKQTALESITKKKSIATKQTPPTNLPIILSDNEAWEKIFVELFEEYEKERLAKKLKKKNKS